MSQRILLSLLLTFGALSIATGCSDACTALSEQVCLCLPNSPEQTACVNEVKLSKASKTEVTAAELSACENYLTTCTCDALARGDRAACGLTRPAQ
ncbi:MAG: hypothetical protein U1E65_18500 [Myxococcota bacterium]